MVCNKLDLKPETTFYNEQTELNKLKQKVFTKIIKNAKLDGLGVVT
jgi:hypothetical protein